MSFPFDPHAGVVLVEAELEGPAGKTPANLALDTGSSYTAVGEAILVALGYDPAASPTRLQITTGSGVLFVPQISVARVRALGLERTAFPVVGHTLPPSAGVDGLLGLDFLRGCVLTIDFRAGQIDLA
jgi:hypothetical protein